MDLKEETTKSLVGKIITGVLALVGLLLLVIWRETLYAKWVQAEAALSKQALMAMLGLAVTVIIIESAWIGYLLFDQHKQKLTRRMFGVLWDKQLNPLCPADQTLLRVRGQVSERDHDIVMCPKCDAKYPLRTDDLSPLRLAAARKLVGQK